MRFFHRSCLLKHGLDSEPDTRKERLIGASPDHNKGTFDHDWRTFADSKPDPMAALSSVCPDSLLEAVAQPIVKGTLCGSVTGNIKAVLAAAAQYTTSLALEYHTDKAGRRI